MTTLSLDRHRYVRAAFLDQYNLILLAGGFCFSLALASWLPLAAALAGELVWLLVAPGIDGFRTLVDERTRRADELAILTRHGATQLEGAHAARIAALEHAARSIEAQVVAWPGAAEQTPELRARLDPLVGLFVELCASRERLGQFLATTPRAALEAEIDELTRVLEDESDFELRVSTRRALTLAERRLHQLGAIEAALRTAEREQETVEKAFAYLTACAVSLGSWDQLFAEIDGIAIGLRSSAASEAETHALLANGAGTTTLHG